MLTDQQVGEVQQLLKRGLSQREIARQLKISKGSVGAIAHGRRRIDPPQPLQLAPPAAGRVARCGDCGVLVELPCVACQARRYANRRKFLLALAANRPPRTLRLVRGLVTASRHPPAPRPRQVA